MCPIIPVPIYIYALLWKCAQSPMCPLVMQPITHVPHHHAPYTYVPYCPCAPLPCSHVDLEGGHATLPICPITTVPMSNGAQR